MAKTFDINQRSIYAMRSIGLGNSALGRFYGMMNMPQPVAKKRAVHNLLLNKVWQQR